MKPQNLQMYLMNSQLTINPRQIITTIHNVQVSIYDDSNAEIVGEQWRVTAIHLMHTINSIKEQLDRFPLKGEFLVYKQDIESSAIIGYKIIKVEHFHDFITDKFIINYDVKNVKVF